MTTSDDTSPICPTPGRQIIKVSVNKVPTPKAAVVAAVAIKGPSGTGVVSVTAGILDVPATLSDRVSLDAANLRHQLGLGTAALQDVGAFDPSGSVTPSSLGLVIGTNVQAHSSNLDGWATHTPFSGTLSITSGKALSVGNSLSISGTDGSSLNIGAGGSLGSAAFTDSSAFDPAGAATSAQAAAQSYADSVVVGLVQDLGDYNASTTNAFPISGSGASGSVAKGDLWRISVVAISGPLLGYSVSSSIRALTDTPGQDVSKWGILEGAFPWIPENVTNRDLTAAAIVADVTNSTNYPSRKAMVDWVRGSSLGSILPTTVNGLTFASQSVGFTVAGGTTSKTLTIASNASVSGTNTGDQDLSGYAPLVSPSFTTPSLGAATASSLSSSGASINATLAAEQAASLSSVSVGWNSAANWASDGTKITHTSGSATSLVQTSGTVVIGTTYKVTLTISNVSGATSQASLGGTYLKTWAINGSPLTVTEYITAKTTANFTVTPGSTSAFSITALSIMALTSGTGDLLVDGHLKLKSAIQDGQGNSLIYLNNGCIGFGVIPDGSISSAYPVQFNAPLYLGTQSITFNGGPSYDGSTLYSGSNALFLKTYDGQLSRVRQTIAAANGNVVIGDSVASATRFQVDQPTYGPGTVSNPAGGTTVTGVNTQFLNTFGIGDTITIGGETVAISAIASQTSMTTAALTNDNSGAVYTLVGGTRFSVKGSGSTIITGSPTAGANVNALEVWSGGLQMLYVNSTSVYAANAGGITSSLFRSSTNTTMTFANSSLSTAQIAVQMAIGTYSQSSGSNSSLSLLPTIAQTGTASQSDLWINRTETSVGSGAQYLINAGTGGGSFVQKFSVSNTGNGYFSGNVGIGAVTPTAKLDIQGTASTDGPTLGSELVTSSVTWISTNWTGSYTAWTHTAGNTSALATSNISAVSGTKYQVTLTVGGTVGGGFSVQWGGQTLSGVTTSQAWGPTASTTGSLIITPASDFAGTVVISIKAITAISTAIEVYKLSGGTIVDEVRTGLLGNSFRGVGSGRYNTTGINNTSNGYQSLYLNTTGSNNTSNGYQSLYSNTTGIINSAIGSFSLSSNTTGSGNTAIGNASLYLNTTGINNSANGTYALYNNTTGSSNTAIGEISLFGNTTGSNNSALGFSAGTRIADGSTANTVSGTSTYLGAATKAKADGDSNETVIGYNAIGNGSNTVTIGNSSVTDCYINGSVRATQTFIEHGYTVATLPATAATGMVTGARCFVTDALNPICGTTVVPGGPAGNTMVQYNGSAWAVTGFTGSNASFPIKEVATGTYSILSTDSTVILTAASTVTLPACASVKGQIFNIKNLSGVSITIVPTGAELIDNATTLISSSPNNLCVQARASGGYVIL